VISLPVGGGQGSVRSYSYALRWWRWLTVIEVGWSDATDRAIVAIVISNGSRAVELLGIRGADLDWS
jgi:hypothetical protein